MFSLTSLGIILTSKYYVHLFPLVMVGVPILPVYLLFVSVYSCIIFIWDMKQTDVGVECNLEVITFDYIYPFF